MSRAKSAMYSEEYYDLSEEEMQAIIRRAQGGDPSAYGELVEIFSNFLTKYTSMLYNCKYSLGDYDIRRFISLFVKDDIVRKFLGRNDLNPEGRKHVYEVMRGINYMVRRYGTWKDVQQTVELTFIQCVERYEKQGDIPFSGYLYSYYFYLLKKNVELMLIDQLGRKTFPLISDDEAREDMGTSEVSIGFTAPPEPAIDDLMFAEVIDEHWVAGDTAYPPFDALTVKERQLLKWRYVNGERSSDIAERLTEHPNTTREHLNKIKKKLANIVEEDTDGDIEAY